jgi:hypothetical protein
MHDVIELRPILLPQKTFSNLLFLLFFPASQTASSSGVSREEETLQPERDANVILMDIHICKKCGEKVHVPWAEMGMDDLPVCWACKPPPNCGGKPSAKIVRAKEPPPKMVAANDVPKKAAKTKGGAK